MSDRGFTPEQIARYRITAAELDALNALDLEEPDHPTPPGETMPQPKRIMLRPDATREERVADLPAYPRSAEVPVLTTRLTRLSETAFSTLSDLDDDLDDLADAFAERFEADDARAATRNRIASTARSHRAGSRR